MRLVVWWYRGSGGFPWDKNVLNRRISAIYIISQKILARCNLEPIVLKMALELKTDPPRDENNMAVKCGCIPHLLLGPPKTSFSHSRDSQLFNDALLVQRFPVGHSQ